MHATLNIALKAARKASQIILKKMERLDELDVTEKSTNDYVTEVDAMAEQAIVETLRQAFPDHGIIAEEGSNSKQNAECVWIIDPLDGTNNYLHGFSHFCISMALKIKGRVEHGLIYDPIRQELFTASYGCGARVNDFRMRVSNRKEIGKSLIGTGFPHRRKQDIARDFKIMGTLYQQVSDIRVAGSAALDLAYVAAGRLDGYYEFGLQSWDIAAGALMVKEAGGYVSDMDGSNKFLTSGNIIAASPKIFPIIADIINKIRRPD